MEHSYGVVPCRKRDGEYEVLLIRDHHHNWGFPKGHPNSQETEKETAARELFEETHLKIESWIDSKPLVNHYTHQAKGFSQEKEVQYFIALTSGEITPQAQEIEICLWLPLPKALEKATFPILKELFPLIQEVLDYEKNA